MTNDYGAGEPGSHRPETGGVDRAPPPQPENAPPPRDPFPWVRLLYALGFAVVAWAVFWFTLFLAAMQFITTAITGQTNPELRRFTANITHYLRELLSFITLTSDERPFPFGPFPNSGV